MKYQLLFVIIVALISSSSLVLPVETSSSRESLLDTSRNSMLANERTIVVPDHFDKIQDAINNASDGDTILVKANIYYENVVVNRSVYLLGEDQRDTIIDGGGGDVLTVVASETVVAGFTIRNVGFSLGRGISIYKANGCVIRNNVIKGNFVGVRIGDKTQETVGNVVRNNNITGNRYGVFLAHSKNSMVCRNVISGNGWNGVEIDWGEGNIVYANTISDSTAYGLEIPIQTPSYHNIIYHNSFVNNTLGCTSSNYENTWDNGYPSGGNFWNDILEQI